MGSLNRGGTETLYLDLFNNSNNAPFKMFCVYRHDGILSKDFQESDVPIWKVCYKPKYLFFIYFIKLRGLIKKVNANILHTNQSIDTLFARISCLGLHTKIIQTTHEFDFRYGVIEKIQKRLSLIMANHNIFVSRALLNHYKPSYNFNFKQVTVLHNCISLDKFNKQPTISLRSSLGINNEVLLIGMVGNFTPGHDQYTICRFLSILQKQNINFHFVFIGAKDNLHPELYENCFYYCENSEFKDKVTFLGSRQDVPELLPQLNSFIYSSHHDAFGIAIIEAMFVGIPVFVNSLDVFKEITEQGKRAILYESRNENDLLNKFLDYSLHAEAYNNCILNNSKWIEETYNIQAYIKSLNNIYSYL